eukprot:5063791-Amphidinium_carterae.1
MEYVVSRWPGSTPSYSEEPEDAERGDEELRLKVGECLQATPAARYNLSLKQSILALPSCAASLRQRDSTRCEWFKLGIVQLHKLWLPNGN